MTDDRLIIDSYTHDDDLIEATRRDGRTRVRVYRLPNPTVIIGRGSDPKKELRVDACLQDRIPVLQRRGGGCSVVIDSGIVIVSVGLALSGLGGHRTAYERISGWLIDTLERLGVRDVRMAGTSDLVIDDRKIAGSCIYRTRDFLLYGATLLVAPDVDRVSRYLQHPPREPDYRVGRDHAAFMGSLRELAGVADVGRFETRLSGLLTSDALTNVMS